MNTALKQKANIATSIATIDKRSNISRRELITKYIEPAIPVVLTDAAQDWKAMGKFTPEFFRKNYEHLSKEVKGVTYKMADFVDLMLASTPENPAPYPFNFNVKQYLPELLEDFKPEIIYAKSDRVNHPLLPKFVFNGTQVYEIFLGGNGAYFPSLHVDSLFLHTQITQLYGSKDFYLFPPEQTPFLYPSAENDKISEVNIFNPDYEKHPLFREANPIKVTVEEGETILFPTKWWHTTKIHEPCISLGRVQLNASNWDDFTDDVYKLWDKLYPGYPNLALPVKIYTKLLGGLLTVQESLKAQ